MLRLCARLVLFVPSTGIACLKLLGGFDSTLNVPLGDCEESLLCGVDVSSQRAEFLKALESVI